MFWRDRQKEGQMDAFLWLSFHTAVRANKNNQVDRWTDKYYSITPAQSCVMSQHTDAETTWPPFSRRHSQMHFLEWKYIWISLTISLKIVPNGPINNILALVQIMAWRRPGDKPLSEPMMDRLPTHICVTRPQWVNKFIHRWNNNYITEKKKKLKKKKINWNIYWACHTQDLTTSWARFPWATKFSWGNKSFSNLILAISQIFAHAMTAELSCHRQNFVVFILSETVS